MVVLNQDFGARQIEACLADRRVMTLAKKFVCLRLPAKVEPEFTDVKDTTGTPILFVTAEGKLIGRFGSFVWPKDFLEYMNLALWATKRRPTKSAPLSIAEQATLAALKRDIPRAEKLLATLSKVPAPNSRLSTAYLVLSDQYRTQRQLGKSMNPLKLSLKYATDVRQIFRAEIRLASAYIRLEEPDAAQASAEKCLKLAKKDMEDQQIAQLHLNRVGYLRLSMKPPKA
jgi:hypothetical protein